MRRARNIRAVLNRVSPPWRWVLFIPVGYGVAVFASTRLAALLDTSPLAGAVVGLLFGFLLAALGGWVAPSARLRVGVFFVLVTLFIGWSLLRGAGGEYWTARSWAALIGAIVGACLVVLLARRARSATATPVVAS